MANGSQRLWIIKLHALINWTKDGRNFVEFGERRRYVSRGSSSRSLNRRGGSPASDFPAECHDVAHAKLFVVCISIAASAGDRTEAIVVRPAGEHPVEPSHPIPDVHLSILGGAVCARIVRQRRWTFSLLGWVPIVAPVPGSRKLCPMRYPRNVNGSIRPSQSRARMGSCEGFMIVHRAVCVLSSST